MDGSSVFSIGNTGSLRDKVMEAIFIQPHLNDDKQN